MKKHIPALIIILLFALVGMKALFHPGLFTAHDIWHQVARLYHYHQAVQDGQFPPYWIANLANGFGYPLFFFSYHLPWILALPLLGIGLSIPLTIKTLFIISYFFSGIVMYFFSFDLFKNKWAALTSTILYLWAPFHFVTILVSAAMGTAFVFTLFPLLLWGLYKITHYKSPLGTIFTSLGLAGIILSHLMTTIFLIPLLSLWIFWLLKDQKNKKNFLKKIIYAGLLGIGLAAFYFLPAIFYSRLTQVSSGAFASLYEKQFVNLTQLIYSKWGYGIADTAKEMNISFQIGIAQWIGVILTFVLIIMKKQRKNNFLGITLMTTFLISIFAMTDISRSVWVIISKIITLDYPTTFLLPATITGSLLAGFVVSQVKTISPFASVLFIIIAIYTNRNHLRVNMYTNIPVSLYVASETTTNSYHEYLPKTADLGLFSEKIIRVLPQNSAIENFKQNSKELSLKISLTREDNITLGHFSFPGLNLYVDEIKTIYDSEERGRIKFPLTAGNYFIQLKFEDTPLIKISKLVTIGSLLYLLFLAFKNIYGKKS
ncbi:hypothetical protein HY404_01445 [Candidatus Microgenomates bacterium]|nr:hypothetical protein [Candidatus Microgenomates bacterium]